MPTAACPTILRERPATSTSRSTTRRASPPIRLGDPDPDLLPGRANQAAPDGPDGEREQGYLWNAALRAHETVRNYGFFAGSGPLRTRHSGERPPYRSTTIPQRRNSAWLSPRTRIWRRSPILISAASTTSSRTTGASRSGSGNSRTTKKGIRSRGSRPFASCTIIPAISRTAADGVNTPETQVADNDYAVGLAGRPRGA